MEPQSTRRSLVSIQYMVDTLSLVKSGWIILFLSSGVISALNLTIPIYMLHLIDHVFMTRNLYNLPGTTALAILAIIFQWVLNIIRPKLISAMIEKKLTEISSFAPFNTQTAEMKKNQLMLIMDLFWMPIFIVALVLMHPALGIFALVASSVMIGVTYANFTLLQSDETSAKQSNLKHHSLIGHIKKFRNYLFLKTSFNKALEPEQSLRIEKYNTQNDQQIQLLAAINGIRLVSSLGMFAIGAMLVIKSSLTPGSVIVGPLLLNLVLLPLMKLKTLSPSNSLPINEIGNPLHGAVAIRKAPKRVRFSCVSHIQINQSEPLFRNINSEIELTGTIVISSEKNNEKNILSQLMTGIQKPTKGNVYYDFEDGLYIKAEELHYPIAYLPEEVDFIHGTIMENLQLHSDATESEIILKATEVGFHERIMRLPEQYETPIGPNNMTLSASEQRILGWIQILVQQASLIVIDGPDLFLDHKFRKQIKDHLIKLNREGTVIILMTNSKYFSSIATQTFGLSNSYIKPLARVKNVEHLRISYEQQG